jgi:hypothetical protein
MRSERDHQVTSISRPDPADLGVKWVGVTCSARIAECLPGRDRRNCRFRLLLIKEASLRSAAGLGRAGIPALRLAPPRTPRAPSPGFDLSCIATSDLSKSGAAESRRPGDWR